MTSPNLSLPYIEAAQAQKEVTHNEALNCLDALVQLSVLDRDLVEPPADPAEGDRYIVPAGATGAWAGQDGKLAVYYGGWIFLVPREGWRAWVVDEDHEVRHDGTGWRTDGWIKAPTSATGDNLAAFDGGASALKDSGIPLGQVPRRDQANSFTGNQTVNATGDRALLVWSDTFTAVAIESFRDAHEHCLLNAYASGGTFGSPADLAAGHEVFSVWPRPRSGGGYNYNTAWNLKAIWDGAAVGWVIGAPAGGAQGAGTLNAVGLYDDGALLSCYVFERALDGAVDAAAWDRRVPDRVSEARVEERPVMEEREVEIDEYDAGMDCYVRRKVVRAVPKMRSVPVKDAEGLIIGSREVPVTETVAVPAAVERRRHEPLRKFAARAHTEYDPLDIDAYARHWKEKRHLTALPNKAKYEPGRGLSTGEWIQRLVETVEIQAVHIETLNQRTKAQQVEIDALKVRLGAVEG